MNPRPSWRHGSVTATPGIDSGKITRPSTPARAGERTPVAGLVHAVTVLAILLVLAPLVKLVPLASLAGVLLSVCWYMAELPLWPRLFRSGGSDVFLLVLACVVTVFVDLIWAVGLGVLAAVIFLFLRKRNHPEPPTPETVEIHEAADEVRVALSGHLHFGRAAEPRAAARILESSEHIDLLVTDVGLPGMNGRQLADIARQHRPELPVLFMTGYAEQAASSGFLEQGMDMISKPFSVDALAQHVRDMLAAGRDA